MLLKPFLFLNHLALPLLLVAGAQIGGWAYSWSLLYSFVLVPLIDWPHPRAETAISKKPLLAFHLVMWLYVPLQMGIWIWALWHFHTHALTPLEATLFTMGVGVQTGGIGITVAHELIHRRARIERALGLLLLSQVHYMHFRIEHVFGHHVWVGTPKDPASAPRGMSVYYFWVYSTFWSYVHAWRWEMERLKIAKRAPLSWRNRMFHYAIFQGLLAYGVYRFTDAGTLLFHLMQGTLGFLLLETLNYIQHYGLRRREKAPGQYEVVTPAHSWDAPQGLTNKLLYNLGLHALHHSSPTFRYEQLRAHPDAPKLPIGYPGAAVLALLPPIWKKIMDPRIPAR